MASALFKTPRRPALRQLVGKTPAFRQWLSKQAGPKKKWEDQFRSQLERSALFDDLINEIRAGKYLPRLQGRWNFDNAPHHQHLRTVQNYMLPYLKQMSECAQEAPWDVCSAAQAAVIRLLEKEQGIVYPHQLHNIIKAMKDVSNASARAQQQENLASESSLQQHAEDHTAAESSAADSARPKSRAGKLSDGNQGLTYVRPTWVTKPQPSLSSSAKATTPERSNDQASAADTTTSESTTPKSLPSIKTLRRSHYPKRPSLQLMLMILLPSYNSLLLIKLLPRRSHYLKCPNPQLTSMLLLPSRKNLPLIKPLRQSPYPKRTSPLRSPLQEALVAKAAPFEGLARDLYLGAPSLETLTDEERLFVLQTLGLLAMDRMAPAGSLAVNICKEINKDITKAVDECCRKSLSGRLEYLKLVLGDIVAAVKAIEGGGPRMAMVDMDDLIITDTSVDEISPEKKYSQQRQKAHSFEMLAFNIYTGDYIGDLHTDERRFLLEQLGLLAREAKLFSFQLCDTVATEIEEVIQSALTSAGHNRFDFLKMLIGNICDAARSVAG
ncbi:hypothetical protein IWZ03DRAFT_362661 [Phyllosticta citriasiana]|uniref:Uncharacterized protein n=1 Tax=Phyllosticta citriasiana TaxID=595635 RepID=A0ABR1KIA2_9PEZI